MSAILVGVVTFIYVGVAVSELRNGNGGMAVVYLGYSVANLGLIWQAMQ